MTSQKSRADRVAPLAAAFAASDLTRLAITDGEFTLEMVRRTVPATSHPPVAGHVSVSEPLAPVVSAPAPLQTVIRAELVGILRFAEPRLIVGQKIDRDREVFSIEALGVRTPVQSGGKGVVVKILVSDGSPVEFGQSLMVIERV